MEVILIKYINNTEKCYNLKKSKTARTSALNFVKHITLWETIVS